MPAVLEGRARAVAKGKLWRAYNDRWVILLRDVDTGLYFTLCRVVTKPAPKRGGKVAAETVVQSFRGRRAAEQVCARDDFRRFWLGYPAQIIRYEALKEFGDHHRRQHWRFQTQVLFVGTEAQIDWVSKLTMGDGLAFDRAKGLFLPANAVRAAAPQDV